MGIIGMNGVAGCFLFVSPVEAVPCYLTYTAMHVAELILRHRSPFDAFEGEGQFRTVLSREKIMDVCEVVKVMYSDSSPFGYFQRMVATIHEYRQSYTGQQLNDIVLKLKELRDLFPNPRFIQHEGYLVLFDTAIGQLERKLDNQTWNELKARADKIPNLADRALVLAWMSESLKDSDHRRRQILVEAAAVVAEIPTWIDRTHRYDALASAAAPVDKTFAKEFYRKAMESSKGGHDESNSMSNVG